MDNITTSTHQNVRGVLIENITEGDLVIRKEIDQESLNELSRSISQNGMIAPILVKQVHVSEYELIVGKRRLLAARRSGLQEIPAVVLTGTGDKDKLYLSLTENLQSEDLTPFEEGWAIFKLVNYFGISAKEVSKHIGKGHRYVRKRLKLLSMPEDIQNQLKEEKIGLKHVDLLTRLSSENDQRKAVQEAIEHDLNAQELAEEISSIEEERRKKRKQEREPKQYTGKKIALKVRRFRRTLSSVHSQIENMDLNGRREYEKELKKLRDEVDNSLTKLKSIRRGQFNGNA